MRALPEHLEAGADEKAAGLVCPDCSGAISVTVLGGSTSSFLYFACRIGHSYSTAEFLEAKEQRLESRLWQAVHSCEELATLLSELTESPFAAALNETQGRRLRERAVRAAEVARQLRAILEAERPLQIAMTNGAADDPPEDERA